MVYAVLSISRKEKHDAKGGREGKKNSHNKNSENGKNGKNPKRENFGRRRGAGSEKEPKRSPRQTLAHVIQKRPMDIRREGKPRGSHGNSTKGKKGLREAYAGSRIHAGGGKKKWRSSDHTQRMLLKEKRYIFWKAVGGGPRYHETGRGGWKPSNFA